MYVFWSLSLWLVRQLTVRSQGGLGKVSERGGIFTSLHRLRDRELQSYHGGSRGTRDGSEKKEEGERKRRRRRRKSSQAGPHDRGGCLVEQSSA